jgi:hypothetical protein
LGATVPAREPLARSTSYGDATAVISFTAQATGAVVVVAALAAAVVALDLLVLGAVLVRLVGHRMRAAGSAAGRGSGAAQR